jgi:hypothetical protein
MRNLSIALAIAINTFGEAGAQTSSYWNKDAALLDWLSELKQS